MADSLDFNILPYFDDFDEDKLFHRILFKPGVAVQARELTQLQTIIQNQIERFGTHFFKNGSRILGGKFDPQDPIDYVRVTLGSSSTRTELVGKELAGATTGVKAKVIYAEADPDENGVSVIFIRYTNSNGDLTEFGNETLNWTDDDNNAQTLITESTNTTGTGSIFGIGEGVLFVRGFFVKFDSQKIALDPFNAAASKRVYFKSTFSNVNSNEDSSLLDNAQGFNNYNAPGADRLKCTLSLVVSSITEDLSDDDHTLLIELRNGQVFERQERTQYNEILDEIAKRTYDESGDYLVRGWELFSRENLDTGTNGGLYANSEGGDTDKLSIGIEKGLAYVKGYEVETLTTRYLDIDKASTYKNVDDQKSIVKMGNSTVLDEIVGLPDPDRYYTVNLYDTAKKCVTNRTAFDSVVPGSVIGTAIVGGYIEEGGQFGQNDAQLRMYLAEISMNAGQSFADVRAIGNTSNFFADVVLDSYSNTATLDDTTIQPRLYYVGSNYVRTVKDDTDTVDTSFTYGRLDAGLTVATDGTVSSSALPAGETLPYGTGTLDTATKENIFLVVTNAGGVDTSDLAGTVTVTGSNTTVVGSNTSFTNLNAGDYIKINGSIYTISSIETDTSLTLTAAANTASANTYAKSYIKGSIIDLNSKGADTGANRSVTASSSQLDLDIDETFDATFTADLIYRVTRDPITQVQKVLRPNRYVTFDVSSYSSQTKFWLGVSDVYRVHSVRESANAFVSSTDGTDVSDNFVLDTGQTPYSYNTSFVKTSTAIANTKFLLVEFDYFEPNFSGGVGYFSIDSYPIDDTVESSTTIKTANIPDFRGINLRNFIDCRPIKSSAATPATTVGGAPSNPGESTTYTISANGLCLPVATTNLQFDYSYYLARRDVLVIDREGAFSTITGEPAVNPNLPKVSDEYMKIANIYIPPYPSFAGTYARILRNPEAGVAIDKVTFNRHTMRDIGKIKKRVKDLEYYNALNLLEKNTLDLTIPDENGLDRFKNGVFVDPFTDLSLSDAGNIDYSVSIDKTKKEARPTYTVDGMESYYGTGTTNIVRNDNLVGLTFTEESFITQPYATTTRNIEFSSYRFIGLLNLNPDIDTWVDTTTIDRTIDLNSDIKPGTEIETIWDAPEINVTGAISGQSDYKVYFRYHNEADGGETKDGLRSHEIAQRLGLSGSEREIDTLPNLYQALSDDELSARYRGTFDSAEAALRYVNSKPDGEKRFFIVQDGKVITEEVISKNYTGIETTINVEEELTEVGSFVTDATLIPYIRPQTIQLTASGLKRNTKYYVFFDGEDMSSYVTPMSTLNQPDVMPPVDDYYPSGGEGDAITSDEYGNVFCALRLPSGTTKRFRVGVSDVTITDSSTNSKASSSYATAKFVSSGLNLQKQRTILGTKVINQETRQVTKNETYTQTRIENQPQEFIKYGPSCSAYSFYIDEADSVEGVFLSSVDIWLSALSTDLGVWFEIREMSPDGGITQNQVPYSEVWMYRDDNRLNVSNNGIDDSTNVNFKSPVYLLNKTQYAFVIHTEGLNPDTYFWVSKLGGTDVSSGNAVTARPLTGTFYTTNNNLNWDIVPDVDLKITFNRAAFGGTVASEKSGTATFNVEDVDYITSSTSLPGTFFNNGEPVRSSEILTLAGVANVAVGDTILSSNNTANAVILSIDGSNYYMDGFDFVAGDTITIRAASNTALIKDTGTVSTVNFGVGVVDKIDTTNNRFDIIHSNGKFFGDAVLRSILPHRHKTVRNGESPLSYENATTVLPNPFAPNGVWTLPVGAATSNTTITAPTYTLDASPFTSFDYTSMLFRPGYINFKDTSCTFKIKTRYSGNNTITSTAETIEPNQTLEFDKVRTLLSRSVEVSDHNSTRSLQYEATMSTPSDYITPIIDTSLMGSVHRMNSLNNDTTNETEPFNGSLSSKYISKVIDFDEDNLAEDLLIIIKEYRPDTTGIKVYVRIKSKYDADSIYQKNWHELTTTKNAVSSNVNKRNYIDTTYQFDDNDRTGTFSEVQYPFTIDATAMVANTAYKIVSLGSEPETTDFTSFGAANNDIGTTFTANNVGTGTGTVRLSTDVVYTGYNQLQIKVGLTGTNAAVYPKIAQLRAIALQQ